MVGAKAVLDTCPDSAGKMELMTQIKYRMESYDEAFESCRELIRSTEEDEYEEERQTNLAAINACLIASGSVRKVMRQNVKSIIFHKYFNMSLRSLYRPGV